MTKSEDNMNIIKQIRNVILIALGMAITLCLLFYTFIFAVIQTSERLDPVTTQETIGR
jgi:hypothetical protein